MKLNLGQAVRFADDGNHGEVTDLVFDPHAQRLTHVVVSPSRETAYLVPLSDIESVGDDGPLSCSKSMADYDQVDDTQFVKIAMPLDAGDEWDVGIEEVSALPYYSFEPEGESWYPDEFLDEVGIRFHKIPKSEVEIRRHSTVVSVDGHLCGDVDGFIVDESGAISHMVLERGHIFGHHDVTIPLSAIERLSTDKVELKLSRDDIQALPRTKVRRHAGKG